MVNYDMITASILLLSQLVMFIIVNYRIDNAFNLIMRLDQAAVEMDKQRERINESRYVRKGSLLDKSELKKDL